MRTTRPLGSRISIFTIAVLSGALASAYQSCAPFGGFLPGADSRPNRPPGRRTAARGAYRCASAAIVASVICCNGEMSSRIQNARPSVDTTRSPCRTCRSVTGTGGNFTGIGCQRSPALNDTHTPFSVPAYNNPRRKGSSRTVRVTSVAGRPFVIFAHVFPKSVVRKTYGVASPSLNRVSTTYAVAGSYVDGSIT